MITVDLKSRKPIYEQITENIKTLILTGYLKPDEQLPAVRKLAFDLAINLNTIQKAYMMLEAQSIVYSIPGRGSFVSAEVQSLLTMKHDEVIEKIRAMLDEAASIGITSEEILRHVNEVFKTDNFEKGDGVL